MPLQLLSELGIGGLLTFVGFMAGLFFYSIHALCKADDRSRPETVAAASALLGATVMGMFDILWYQYGMCLLFFAVGAILTAPFSGSEVDIW
jgi:hypothetical protein